MAGSLPDKSLGEPWSAETSYLASLYSEGDSYIILGPSPSHRQTFRLSKNDVKIIRLLSRDDEANSSEEPMAYIQINPRAVCLASDVLPVSKVLQEMVIPIEASDDLERAPQLSDLEAAVGKHISTFCGNGFNSDGENHCAHFVSHLLKLSPGMTCRTLTGGMSFPASVRVHEIFANCSQVGDWTALPTPLNWGLIFTTNPANVDLTTKTMANVARKHVGIFFGGSRTVYQYKNAIRQVVRQTPTEFGAHYAAPDNGLFWGTI